eukprot:11048933-Alexandrium_andersonii.AAC.1
MSKCTLRWAANTHTLPPQWLQRPPRPNGPAPTPHTYTQSTFDDPGDPIMLPTKGIYSGMNFSTGIEAAHMTGNTVDRRWERLKASPAATYQSRP